VILCVTSTAFCGSDLHLFHGTVQGMEPGQTLGHENIGIVEEAGPAVEEVKIGDKVMIIPKSQNLHMNQQIHYR